MYGHLGNCKKRNQFMEMAVNSAFRNGRLSVFCSSNRISNLKIIQEILAYIVLGIAIFYLIKKFFVSSNKDDGCNPDCGCS